MTSLSQHDVDDSAERSASKHLTTKASLQVLGLFLEMKQVEKPGSALCLVPMTLPCTCRDASLGAAQALTNELDSSEGTGTTLAPSMFLLASRDGTETYEAGSAVPRGFVSDANCLLKDDEANPTLLTPLCRMFSPNEDTSNLLSRCAVETDMKKLREIVERLAGAHDVRMDVAVTGSQGSQAMVAFLEVILVFQTLLEKGVTFCEMHKEFAKDEEARRQFHRSALGGRLRTEIAQDQRCDIGTEDERMHWLALWGILRGITPAFLSPVASSHEVLATLLSCGMLKVASEGTTTMVEVPHLVIDDDQREGIGGSYHTVLTTMSKPAETTKQGLSRAVRHWFQKSLKVAEGVECANAPCEPTHR